MTNDDNPHPHQQEPTMGLLEELAVRCEAATGADRELDAAVGLAVGYNFVCEPRYVGQPGPRYGYVDHSGSRIEPGQSADMCVQPYTSSVDAAMSIVPEALEWDREGKDKWGRINCMSVYGLSAGKWIEQKSFDAATPALTLTAACLRARHALALPKGSEG